MALLITVAFLLGALLGIKFRVLILIPALGATVPAVVATGIARGDAAWAILITLAAAFSSLQVGYLCGATTQCAFANSLARANRNLRAMMICIF
jgi:hypothetical protein